MVRTMARGNTIGVAMNRFEQNLIYGSKISATLAFLLMAIFPLLYAVTRLESVTDMSSLEAIRNFFEEEKMLSALKFSMLEASISMLATIAIGLPLAWILARYRWKRIRFYRSLLTLPFVMPSIIAAMGFLMLIEDGGLLTMVGIDLRLETGLVGDLATTTGWKNPGHFIALVLAHAWFNASLVIRFVEPTLSTMDKSWEEQMRFLPQGKSLLGKLRHLWAPIIGPAVMCAACLSFIFSFTSFALVRWLTPNQNNLENLMAQSGGSAGIYGYRVDTSEIVLSTSLVQFLILILALYLTASMQRRHTKIHSQVSEHSAISLKSKPNKSAKAILIFGIGFCILPLLLIVKSSFMIRDIKNERFYYSIEAWKEAWGGDYSTTSIPEALSNSLLYAIITLAVSLPIGYLISSFICDLEKSGRHKLAKIIDISTMIPLALSGVMIGLGILLGLLKWSPELFNWNIIPAVPHIILTTPFVIRILLPAMRSIDPIFKEQGLILKMSGLRLWWHSRMAFLRAPLVVSGSLTIAFSLGEFGASWILVRSGSWDTLSILIDQLMDQPKYDPLIQPMAMAAATVLMIITLLLFAIAEWFRPNNEGSGF